MNEENTSTAGCVYAISTVDREFTKFGWSKDVEKRLMMLQTSNPKRLFVVAVAEWPRKYEKAIHVMLSSYNSSGEWFADSDDVDRVVSWMNANKKGFLDDYLNVSKTRASQESDDGVLFISREFYQKMLDVRLDNTAMLVWYSMHYLMSPGNMIINVSHEDLAVVTSSNVTGISVAVATLIEHDMIVKVKRGEYMSNPVYAYIGKKKWHADLIAKYRRLKQDQINKAATSRP